MVNPNIKRNCIYTNHQAIYDSKLLISSLFVTKIVKLIYSNSAANLMNLIS